TLDDVLECRRVLVDVLGVTTDRISYVLNHPQPYAGVACAEFAAATGTPWVEVPFGAEGPSQAALRGESLLGTRRNNPVARVALGLAETVSREAREGATLPHPHH